MEHINEIISHLFLGDNDLLGSVDNKVTTLIMYTLSGLNNFLISLHLLHHTVIRVNHNGHFTKNDSCEVSIFFFCDACASLFINIHHLQLAIKIEVRLIIEVSESGNGGCHLFRGIVFLVCRVLKETDFVELDDIMSVSACVVSVIEVLILKFLSFEHDSSDVINELIEGIDLLEDETNGVEVGVNDLPNIVFTNTFVLLVFFDRYIHKSLMTR